MQMKLALAFEKLVCHNCQKTEAYGYLSIEFTKIVLLIFLMKKFKWKKQHVCLCLTEPWRFYFATSKNKTSLACYHFVILILGRIFTASAIRIFFHFPKKVNHGIRRCIFYNWMKGWPKCSHSYFQNCIHFPCRTTTKNLTRTRSFAPKTKLLSSSYESRCFKQYQMYITFSNAVSSQKLTD